MIRHLLCAVTALAGLESMAAACSCEAPESLSDADKDRAARRIAVHAVSIAEVEMVRPIDTARREGELYRTVRHLFGTNQPEFRMARRFETLPDGTVLVPPNSCEFSAEPGKRVVMAFFPAGSSWQEAEAIAGLCGVTAATAIVDFQSTHRSNLFDTSGLCTQLIVQSPDMIERIKSAARKLGRDPG
jgi:hypothetical protein